MRYIYLDGQFLPQHLSFVSTNDRSYQFGDGLYEVVCAYEGVLIDFDAHAHRLGRNGKELSFHKIPSRDHLLRITKRLMRLNGFHSGLVYIQLSRGVAPRSHVAPHSLAASLFIELQHRPVMQRGRTICALTHMDNRSQLPHLKATSLLPNIHAKHKAVAGGHDDIIYIHEGQVQEAGSSNVFIVKEGVIKTPPASSRLVPGVSRERLIALIKAQDLPFVEEVISSEELLHADEVCISHSSNGVSGVVRVNDIAIGAGAIGEMTSHLFNMYLNSIGCARDIL